MNYEGEKFLLKLYRELYKEESVKHSGTISDDKFELLRKYLDRLESSEKAFTREKESAVNFLKNRYYDKYIIKEEDIPESYYELQKRIALERGYGHIKYTNEMKHKEAYQIIKNQQLSLDKWLNYLMKENTYYPMWARYWAFQGMLKLGKYDNEKHSFTKRSKGTTSPFIELNAEALALTIEAIVNYQKGTKIDDENLEELIKSGNFGKMYAYNMWKLIENEKKNQNNKVDTSEGIWKIYIKGEEKELSKTLEGKGTGWCITGADVSKRYLDAGNIHIYYTKDKDGNYTMPRVCIRQSHGKIAEVRGIEKDQNLEDKMLEITDKKLDEFPDKKEYKKKVSDMKKLTQIYNKNYNAEELTKEDLIFLYEIETEIKGFGWFRDSRIDEIKSKRNQRKDLAIVYNCEENQVGLDEKELYTKDLKVYIGNINIYDTAIPENFKIPNIIFGHLDLSNLRSAKGLENLQMIRGNASFDHLVNAEGLDNLQNVGGSAFFWSLTNAEGLENLQSVGGTAHFNELAIYKGITFLESLSDFESIILADSSSFTGTRKYGVEQFLLEKKNMVTDTYEATLER